MEESSSLAEPLRLEEMWTDSMVVDDSSMEVASVEDMSKSWVVEQEAEIVWEKLLSEVEDFYAAVMDP
jgi:hypothetical protein